MGDWWVEGDSPGLRNHSSGRCWPCFQLESDRAGDQIHFQEARTNERPAVKCVFGAQFRTSLNSRSFAFRSGLRVP